MKQKHQTLLLLILIASIISTSLHYTDNAIFVDRYPEPEWFTTSGVFMTWAIMTLVGILGYWLYTQEKFWASYLFLSVYSFTGLSSPAHYFYGAMSVFSTKMHALIWSDALTGLLVLGFAIWSALLNKDWQKIDNSLN
ncbi:MAG: hypothetical protein MUD14_17740 [Hydrococcus sp. Prado102]|jgi:hypothetical protein|nr:hypothetical protein [Hydrococcus sp. Prado102]